MMTTKNPLLDDKSGEWKKPGCCSNDYKPQPLPKSHWEGKETANERATRYRQ